MGLTPTNNTRIYKVEISREMIFLNVLKPSFSFRPHISELLQKGKKMKSLLLFVMVFVSASWLIPATGFAQFQNELGIYTEEMAVNEDAAPMSVHMVYLVITNPYNDFDNTDILKIHGYECGITVDGPGEILTLDYPVWGLNIGELDNQFVAYGHEDIRVYDGAAVLSFMEVMYTGDGTEALTLTLVPAVPASIAGKMSYLDGHQNHEAELMPMTSVSGDWSTPVFGFNAEPQVVATESTSFDQLKAMFR